MPEIKTTKLGKDYCPHCNEIIDACSSMEGATPEPGDVTVCFYCVSILQFRDDMSIQLLPDVVVDSFEDSFKKQLRLLQQSISRAKREHPL
jgi:hypothetical protein